MRRKEIRICSMLLVLALAFSLLPTLAFAGNEGNSEATAFTLDFTAADTSDLTLIPKYTNAWYVKEEQVLKGGNWEALTDAAKSNVYGSDSDLVAKYATYSGLRYIVSELRKADIESGYDSFAIKFTAPASGIYDISADAYGSGSGGYAEIFIDGRLVEKKCLHKDVIGTAKKQISFENGVYITAGEHTLTIKHSLYSGKTSLTNGFFGFTFTPNEGFGSVSLTYDKDYILLTDTEEKVSLSMEYSTGTNILPSDATVSYSTSPSDVATVDADGTIRPLKAGEVTVTASVTVGTVTKEASVDILVKEKADEDPYEFALDFTAADTSDLTLIPKYTDRWYIEEGQVLKDKNWTFLTDATNSSVYGSGSVLAAKYSLSGNLGYIVSELSKDNIENGYDSFSIKFTAPASGVYDISADVYGSGAGGNAEIFIDGRLVEKKCLHKDVIGIAKKQISFGNGIYLTAGKHTLTIKNSIYTGTTLTNGFFGFTFTPNEGLSSVSLAYDKDYILLAYTNGEKLTLSGEYSSGTGILPSDATVVYSATPSDVATVDADGSVKPLKAGEVKVTASITVGDVTKEASLDLLVKDVNYDHAELTFPEEKFYVDGSMEITAKAVLEDGMAAEAEYVTASFETDDESVAKVETVDGKYILKTFKEGTATLTAHVTFDNETKDVEKQITVVQVTSFTLDFNKVTSDISKLDTSSGDQSTHAIKLGNEFYGSNWKLLTDAKNSTIFANKPDTALTLRNLYGNYVTISKKKEDLDAGNDTLSFEFTSPISGTFDVDAYMYFGGSGGIAEIFVDGKSVGSFDSNKDANGGSITKQPADFTKSVTIEEGKHILTIKNSVHPGQVEIATGFYSISFNPSGDFESLDLTHKKSYILLGNTAGKKLTLDAKYASGTYVDVENDAEVTFESSNEAIATVTPDGVVKPISVGNVTITATVTVNGITKSDELTLEIKDSDYDRAEIDVVHDLFYEGGTTEISATGFLSDGTQLEPDDITVTFESDNTDVATIEEGTGVLKTLKEGTAKITAHVTFGGVTKDATKEIKVVPVDLESIEAKTADNVVFLLDKDGSKLIVKGRNNDGSVADITGAEFSYKSLSPELVTVDENGNVYAIGRGPAKVLVTVTLGETVRECVAEVIASSGKTEPTVYTYEMRENALENIKKYDWAESLKKSAVKSADRWLEKYEAIYDLIMYEGIPRSYTTGLEGTDDFGYTCAYCFEDIRENYHSYAWSVDPFRQPFKIKCPNCARSFPSNDFESFYELGLDRKRQFNRLRALDAHRAMLLEKGVTLPETAPTEERRADIDRGLVLTAEERAYFGYGVKGGYLHNDLYPEAAREGILIWPAEYDANGNVTVPEVRVTEDNLSTYAVDDGFGWDTGEWSSYSGGKLPVLRPFIAIYHHWIYGYNVETFMGPVLDSLMDAYLYTGNIKYARAGAIILDRVADVYPSLDFSLWPEYQSSDGGKNNGKAIGCIWECGLGKRFVKAYDAFYPAFDDPKVIEFLSAKAAEFGLENPKTSGDLIRENCENGLVRETLKAVRNGAMDGNFGMHQSAAAYAAIALNTDPESSEIIGTWLGFPAAKPRTEIEKYGITFSRYNLVKGGEMTSRYINSVDRDGFGNEIGAGYNQSWLTGSSDVAEVIYRSGKYPEFDLYSNPKYRKMFGAIYNMTMAGNYTLQLGDETRTASTSNQTSALATLRAFRRIGDPIYAQILYNLKGGDLDSVYIDIFEKNAGDVQDEIKQVIEEYGEYKLGSRNLTGFGLAVLSGGELVKNGGVQDYDSRRDTWMSYTMGSTAHSHRDKLQMGIDAYGFNFTPDLGYPEATSGPNRSQWVYATISHNTVVVDGKTQTNVDFGYPYHYDGDGLVKLIDVDAPGAYDETDIYRRTLVSVDASEEVSYTVDFFRVRGGSDHTYSFHTQSADGVTTDDLTLVPQVDENGNYIGSYAGPNVPVGADPGGNQPNNTYPIGYTWFHSVKRDENPQSGNFSVNFKQTDFKKQVKDSTGLNLKFTALNDWTPSSVGIAAGDPPNRAENTIIPHLDYMLIHNKGENLDTLFTSVIQPYKGEEYIESTAAIPLICNGEESEDDASRAVKVKLKSGRTDYIIYATNNDLTYTLQDGDVNIEFNGFIGVYSVNEKGKNIYSYVNDGTKIANLHGEARYVGEVTSFTKELVSENEITVTLEETLTEEQIAALAGEHVYIESDGVHNAVYKIEGASGSGNVITLDIGDVSPVRKFANTSRPEQGYVYNIAEGRKLYIPLSSETHNKPIITPLDGATVSAGSLFNAKIVAEAVDGEKITYIGTLLPRGASLDSETGEITWKPTKTQIGENGFVITVRDESGRENSTSFVVEVFGSTTGGSSSGGGGGGGADVPPTGDPEDPTVEPEEPIVDPEEPTVEPDVPTEKGFTDLGNHAWAEESINALAEAGIIKGTSESTFAPANNITRADFAILLVRAFKLESENTENFADVNESDYFAEELAIARNTGLVGGIGDNNYAPRNTITRQDMMVILYRALTKLEVELNPIEGKDVTSFADYNDVADYAAEAVKALVEAGLVNGKGENLAGSDKTTRAEVAVLLKRILDYIK